MLAVGVLLLIALGTGDTLEFCENGAEEQLVVFNNISQTVYITSPNHNNSYSISNNCSITIQLLVSAPMDVHIKQQVTECSVPYEVNNAASSCDDSNTTHIFYVTFRNDITSNISIILPAGNGSSFSCVVSAHNLPVTTSTTNLVTSTSISLSTITELTELSSTEDSTTTPPDTSTTTHLLSTTYNAPSTTVGAQQSTRQDPNAFWKDKVNILAVGAGAGGLLLVICIIAMSCVLCRRHSNSKQSYKANSAIGLEDNELDDYMNVAGSAERSGSSSQVVAERWPPVDEYYSEIPHTETSHSVESDYMYVNGSGPAILEAEVQYAEIKKVTMIDNELYASSSPC